MLKLKYVLFIIFIFIIISFVSCKSYCEVIYDTENCIYTGVPAGTEPNIVIEHNNLPIPSGDTFNFYSTSSTSNRSVTFTITNTGKDDLILMGYPYVQISGDPDDIFKVTQPNEKVISYNERVTFEIKSLSSDYDMREIIIKIPNNGGNTFTMTLTDNPSKIQLVRNGNIIENEQTVIHHINKGGLEERRKCKFTIKNVGNSNLELLGTPIITIDGVYETDMFVENPSVRSIPPGGEVYFSVGLESYVNTEKTFIDISIENNDFLNNIFNMKLKFNIIEDNYIAGGGAHSVAVKEDGTAWAWGLNEDGQLGNNSNRDKTNPVKVTDLTHVVRVSGNWHSLAVKEDGTVWAWGLNDTGQLGDGTNYSKNVPVQVSELTGIVDVQAGYAHSLALKDDGTVWAWGNNYYGQLGDGTGGDGTNDYDKNIPVQVSGLTNIISISSWGDHSLAVKEDNTVWAWGNNYYGQLGDGTYNDSNIPVQIATYSNIKKIAGGMSHSLLLTDDGNLRVWGDNSCGQLGDGTNDSKLTPTLLTNITNVVDICATGVFYDNGDEYHYSLALKGDGTVWAWGDNYYGQLGDGTYDNSNVPKQVLDLTNIINISTGQCHSLALKEDGTVWAWGDNYYGQLGDGMEGNEQNIPVKVVGLSKIIGISTGESHSTAVSWDGIVYAWGNNSWGQLGDGSVEIKTSPVQSNMSYSYLIDSGFNHNLIIKQDISTVWAWGNNSCGQLGNNDFNNIVTDPVQTLNLDSVILISGGNNHSLALIDDGTGDGNEYDGTVWTWGDNSSGQLGDGGTNMLESVPIEISSMTDVIEISAGSVHSLALKEDGTVWAWGDNFYGQLGDGNGGDGNGEWVEDYITPDPVQVSGLTDVAAISAGWWYSLALKEDGTVWAWGENASGQLGDGTATNKTTPVQVSGLTNVTAISGGNSHSLALKDDGTVWAWGKNSWGQLGDGTTTNSNAPVQVNGLTDVIEISAGGSHSLALRGDELVWAWGDNYYGQLGTGLRYNSYEYPVQVDEFRLWYEEE